MSEAAWPGALLGPVDALPDPLALRPLAGPFEVTVRPPGSKSLTNRALLLAGLAEGRSVLRGALVEADDAARMIGALRALGAGVEWRDGSGREPGSLVVDGVAGRPRGGAELFLNNAGTATRFLTGVACLADGPVTIDGNERMRERPIGELVALLRRLGVTVEEAGEPGRVPLRVEPARVVGGAIEVEPTLSSQFVSALLMLAPWTEEGIELRFAGPATSPSYVVMTLRLLERLGATGVEYDESDLRSARVGPGGLRGFEYDVEPDASGATYFWGAAAVSPGSVCTVEGLDGESLQGDASFVGLLGSMGAAVHRGRGATTVAGQPGLTPIDADLTDMPDAAMTLASVASFASGPSRVRGLRTLRVKETDRLEAMRVELGRVGVGVKIVEEGADEGILLAPPLDGFDESDGAPGASFETYDDHRMAMSLALLSLRRPGLSVRDPGCVAKTYPSFWREWARLHGAGPGA